MTTSSLHPKKDYSRKQYPRITWLEAEHYEKAGKSIQNNDRENKDAFC